MCYRFSCVPVDFEVVNVNSSLINEDDINNAIMAIRRNGVALKGQHAAIAYNRHSCENYAKIIFYIISHHF